MRVLILHQEVALDAPADEQDVLVQTEVVAAALARLGHAVSRRPCSLNLDALARTLQHDPPDAVFNLVESLAGSDRLQPCLSAVLDLLRVPYTGCPTEAIFLASHKLLAKERMRAAGLPTPDWLPPDGFWRCAAGAAPANAGVWLVKTVHEHASFGIDDEALVRGPADVVAARRTARAATLARPCFAEAFVAGREFNLSLLAGAAGPQVLPPAEIDFSAFPPEKPAIVGYAAKWEADSFEFVGTPRRFDFPAADRALLDELSTLAVACWREFHLRGYARVDFRVDERGRPWILEINVNPCLSPDAGFAAACAQANLEFHEVAARILSDLNAAGGETTT